MNPFKVGDSIVIKPLEFLRPIYDYSYDESYEFCDSVVHGMLAYAGKVTTITESHGPCCRLKGVSWNWDYQWLDYAKTPKGNTLVNDL